MRVWIVEQAQADEWITLGVYSNRRAAQRAVDDLDFASDDYSSQSSTFDIKEWPVQNV